MSVELIYTGKGRFIYDESEPSVGQDEKFSVEETRAEQLLELPVVVRASESESEAKEPETKPQEGKFTGSQIATPAESPAKVPVPGPTSDPLKDPGNSPFKTTNPPEDK